jgi:ABC-type uncharacterized transport system ATPase subunit
MTLFLPPALAQLLVYIRPAMPGKHHPTLGGKHPPTIDSLIIAREMMKDPKLIVASYLTRGLDVQSTLIARQALMQARNEGTAVLLISEDLDELFSLSDKLIVLFDGRVVGEFKPAETDFYEIGYLMTGSKGNHDSKH